MYSPACFCASSSPDSFNCSSRCACSDGGAVIESRKNCRFSSASGDGAGVPDASSSGRGSSIFSSASISRPKSSGSKSFSWSTSSAGAVTGSIGASSASESPGFSSSTGFCSSSARISSRSSGHGRLQESKRLHHARRQLHLLAHLRILEHSLFHHSPIYPITRPLHSPFRHEGVPAPSGMETRRPRRVADSILNPEFWMLDSPSLFSPTPAPRRPAPAA